MGYSGTICDLSELTAEIIGYYDESFRDFINPGVPPRVGTPVSLAENDYLSRVLSRAKSNKPGSATMGWLSSRAKEDVNIAIDIDAIVSTHLAIIASTGAGKESGSRAGYRPSWRIRYIISNCESSAFHG